MPWARMLTAGVLIVCGTTAAVWVLRHDTSSTASPEDCAVVEALGREWIGLVNAINVGLANGPGERRDWLAVAEREAAMSDKLRAAADSTSTPEFQEQLTKWADGAELQAKLQRDSANRLPGAMVSPDTDADALQAAKLINEGSGALIKACPHAPPAPNGH